MIEVSCQCGSVALQITGAPIAQVYCHCTDCQIAHGAAYSLNSVYLADDIQILRGTTATDIIQVTPRLRCIDCATRLFNEVSAAGLRSLNAYLLPDGYFTPHFHLHCDDAVLPVQDELPHFRALPLAFGGSDEVTDW